MRLNWSLVGPRGTEVTDLHGVGSRLQLQPDPELVAGDYTGGRRRGDHTASYAFRLLDVTSATQITPARRYRRRSTPGNETDVYQFNAQAGDRFCFDQLSLSGGTVYWRLIDPNGRQFFLTSFNNVDVQTLPLTAPIRCWSKATTSMPARSAIRSTWMRFRCPRRSRS
jgi:hypothetical protein